MTVSKARVPRASGYARLLAVFDNAMCESFFGTLESELLMRERFATHEQARGRLFWFLEGWYNLRRLPSSIRYRSPLEFDDEHIKNRILLPCG